VNKLGQTIIFGSLSNKNYGDAPFNVAATSTSGLPVTFSSSNTAVATVSANTVSLTGPGTVTITASQAGDANYAAAANVGQSFTVIFLPPTEPASFIEFSNVTANSMTIECFPGDGNKRLIVIKPVSPTGFFAPVNNNFYSAGFTSGTCLVVMNDVGSIVTVTGLSADTRYYVKVFEFNELGAYTSYLVSGAPTASQRTLIGGGGGALLKMAAASSDAAGMTVTATNPFRDKLTIHIETSEPSVPARISLVDLQGRTIHESNEKTNTTITIDQPMTNGAYLLKVLTPKAFKTMRLMKLE
jgi:hypothetical protein